jgi:hypothetical protein
LARAGIDASGYTICRTLDFSADAVLNLLARGREDAKSHS